MKKLLYTVQENNLWVHSEVDMDDKVLKICKLLLEDKLTYLSAQSPRDPSGLRGIPCGNMFTYEIVYIGKKNSLLADRLCELGMSVCLERTKIRSVK